MLERLANRLLRLGGASELVAPLAEAVAAHPLREPLVRALILTLSAVNRQPEAIAAYRQACARLADELGVDPSPSLRAAYELARSDHSTAPSLPLTAVTDCGPDGPRVSLATSPRRFASRTIGVHRATSRYGVAGPADYPWSCRRLVDHIVGRTARCWQDCTGVALGSSGR